MRTLARLIHWLHHHPRVLTGLRLGYMAALGLAFWLALQPVSELPIQNFNDKLAHALGLGSLTLAAGVLYPAWSPIRAGGLLLAYGVAIELAQATVPWRSASLGDLLADAVGVLMAVLLLHRYSALRFSRISM